MKITSLNPWLRERCLTIAELSAYYAERFFTAFCKHQLPCRFQGRNHEYFRAWKISWNKCTSVNISSTIHVRKSLQGRFRIFLPRYS